MNEPFQLENPLNLIQFLEKIWSIFLLKFHTKTQVSNLMYFQSKMAYLILLQMGALRSESVKIIE